MPLQHQVHRGCRAPHADRLYLARSADSFHHQSLLVITHSNHHPSCRTGALLGVFALLLTTPGASAHEGAHGSPHSAPFTTRDGAKHVPPVDQDGVFHFVVYGDRTGGVPAGLKVLEQAVVDTNLLDPDLVLTVGDLIQGYNETPQWLEQMAEYKAIMNRLNMRWYPVAGNHDVYWRGESAPPPGHHEANYEQHFGPLWYAFQHKNAGFIVLYSDEGDPATNEKSFSEGRLQNMSDEQLEFLNQALQKLSAADHVFVFLHHPRWIGGGYSGSNWDVVHEKLKSAGNVSAVFAGHIHHMRYDGERDGIGYYTLATTGGHLGAEIPDAGYLHHLNMVTVRPEGYSVASIPIGAVIDPQEFTPAFLAQVDAARAIRPLQTSAPLPLAIDGGTAATVTFQLRNPTERPVAGTVMFGTPARPSRDWTTTLDHQHFQLDPGQATEVSFQVMRPASDPESLTIPAISTELEMIGETARVQLPAVETGLKVELAAVPADYFAETPNHALEVKSEAAAVRIDAAELKVPDGPLTLEAWVKPAQLAGHRGIIAKTEMSEFALFFDEGVPQFDVFLGQQYVSAIAPTVLSTDRWTHLAGVYDGRSVQLYVDGRRVAERAGQGERRRNPLPLFIGADPDRRGAPTRPFLGQIDEVRLSTGAVYDGPFQPARRLQPLPNSVLMLHFDRSFGPFVLDHSASATTAVLGSASKLVPVP